MDWTSIVVALIAMSGTAAGSFYDIKKNMTIMVAIKTFNKLVKAGLLIQEEVDG